MGGESETLYQLRSAKHLPASLFSAEGGREVDNTLWDVLFIEVMLLVELVALDRSCDATSLFAS